MAAARRVLVMLCFVAVSVGFSWSAASNSAGAPSNSAETGCTCHNQMASSGVTVTLAGLPPSYAANTTYNLTISVTGGPMPVPGVSQNQGGFALAVSAGSLAGGTGVQVQGTFATHTAQGNNQRSWQLTWTSPLNATENVTFNYAANSVNGDGLNGGGLDQWNKGTMALRPAMMTGNETTPPAAEDGSTPALGVFGTLAGSLLAATWWTRRGDGRER